MEWCCRSKGRSVLRLCFLRLVRLGSWRRYVLPVPYRSRCILRRLLLVFPVGGPARAPATGNFFFFFFSFFRREVKRRARRAFAEKANFLNAPQQDVVPHRRQRTLHNVPADHAQLKNCIPFIKGIGICLDVGVSCILVCMRLRRPNFCLP